MTKPAESSSSINVLIVDDVYATRRILKRLLKKLGYSKLDEAPSGGEAIEKIKNGKYELVVCDFNLGDMDAVQILREVKSDDKLKTIPFVMISSDPSMEQIHESRELGICHYLLKPFDSVRLQEKIEIAFQEQAS
ncbi:MAG: response regulator [Deltaproteobacteria bacterium]|nr:response regulator [Deltaproteobacteria bacterium]